jgi:anion-transporting  ArsA/GET3 family ATPase
MAAERLHALHRDPRFDLVIVDTPPTRNALDFLDAPNTLARFIDHPLFKMLMLPTRRGLRVLNLAAQPVLKTIGRVVGGDVLADAIAFFQAFSGMETGFRERADEVIALLASDVTRFVLVASPRADTIEEARYFAGRLERGGLTVHAVVVNRCTPTFGDLPAKRPRSVAMAALWDNLRDLQATAATERAHVDTLLADGSVPADVHTSFVPTLPGDVHTMAALETIRFHLFPPTR